MKIFRFSEYSVRRYNFKIIIIIAALCVIGYLILNSAMVNDVLRESTLQKQLIGLGVGAALMILISLVDYHFIVRISPAIYLLVLISLALVLVMGVNVNNATRWLNLGFMQLQPSEFAKAGLIVVFAAFFQRVQETINRPLTLLLSIVLFLVPAFMIYREPDLSTTVVIAFIFVCMIYVAKISYKWILAAVGAAGAVVAVFFYRVSNDEDLILNNYQVNRIMAWINPEKYSASGLTTQQDNSILAISSGQLYGKGLNTTSFESVKNGNFLSEENCDFIFSVIGEELGFIGSMVVLGLIALLVIQCFRIAYRAKDLSGRLMAAGMGCLIAFQTFVNVGVATGLLPNTGLPLPFMSAGVSSLLSLFIGMGVVLNVGMQRTVGERD